MCLRACDTGGDGVLYTWDVRSQRCLAQQRDEGAVDVTALALSPDGSYIATGGGAGVVNLYRRRADGSATLLKSLMNLTTGIDNLCFNHDSQMMLMCSRMKREALRLVHMPSMTVFANWPTSRTPLHYVHAAAFSPHSGFLAVGNAKGRALLYRLHHYGDA